MAWRRTVLSALLALAPVPVWAQSVVGAWTGAVLTQQGQTEVTTVYRNDGTYQTVEAVPSGERYMFWGSFSEQPIDAVHETVSFRLTGWLPQRICAVGGACTVFAPAAPAPITVAFPDASSMTTPSGSFHRIAEVRFPVIPPIETAPMTLYCRANPKNSRDTFCVP